MEIFTSSFSMSCFKRLFKKCVVLRENKFSRVDNLMFTSYEDNHCFSIPNSNASISNSIRTTCFWNNSSMSKDWKDKKIKRKKRCLKLEYIFCRRQQNSFRF